ncbi:hypothetical protein VitviT2T_026472 [Vitis vinifera]|uniref:Pentatricopeptide repeat-containing protein n=1 Tax=Vitis vinifera TaxID=29760 RepID=A0ABY9DMI8_VITVI|nr:hypothetical protein VitviT2T_026472 [Vitis vinifera]
MAACVTLAFLNCGQQIHGRIIQRGLDGNLALSNALIDMYSKCGNITNSHQVFWGMSHRDLVSWTTMMIGYETHGYGEEVVELFDKMVRSGSCGTGVFFPRGTGNPLDSRKKQGVSTALIPARVAQALKLNFDEMGVVSPSLGGRFSLQHGRRNSLYPPQKQHWPAPPAMKHQEMDVPRGWTH